MLRLPSYSSSKKTTLVTDTHTHTQTDYSTLAMRPRTARLITHNTLTSIDDKLDDDSDEYTPSPLLHSCEEIKCKWPSSPSDYHIIADSHGHARHVYCYMEELCNSTGGWMRVAYLNMTDSSEKCPEGFRLYSENGVRACG